jgi:hypothetical protein
LPFPFGHRPRVCLQIQVCFAGAILSDNLIEAAISGYFQKVCDEFCCATEGTISLAYSPFLPVASGPIISCYVEGILEEVIRSLEHRLLGFQSFNPNFPQWERLEVIQRA